MSHRICAIRHCERSSEIQQNMPSIARTSCERSCTQPLWLSLWAYGVKTGIRELEPKVTKVTRKRTFHEQMFILRTPPFPGPSAACAGELGHQARKAPDHAPHRIKESVKPHPNSAPENVLHCKNIIRTIGAMSHVLGGADRQVSVRIAGKLPF